MKVNNYFKLIIVIYFRKIFSDNISILFQLLFYPIFIIKNYI